MANTPSLNASSRVVRTNRRACRPTLLTGHSITACPIKAAPCIDCYFGWSGETKMQKGWPAGSANT